MALTERTISPRRWLDQANGLAFLDVEVPKVPADGDYLTAAALGASKIIGVLGVSTIASEGPPLPTKAFVIATITVDVPDATDTVVIDGRTYTWSASPSSAYEVTIGADIATCVTNLIAAINASGTAGTEYASGTEKHETCEAEAIPGNTAALKIQYRVPGLIGNGVAVSETGDELAFDGTALRGGFDGGPPVQAFALPNTQTDSIVEDDAGDLFLKHTGLGKRTVRVSVLAEMSTV